MLERKDAAGSRPNACTYRILSRYPGTLPWSEKFISHVRRAVHCKKKTSRVEKKNGRRAMSSVPQHHTSRTISGSLTPTHSVVSQMKFHFPQTPRSRGRAKKRWRKLARYIESSDFVTRFTSSSQDVSISRDLPYSWSYSWTHSYNLRSVYLTRFVPMLIACLFFKYPSHLRLYATVFNLLISVIKCSNLKIL